MFFTIIYNLNFMIILLLLYHSAIYTNNFNGYLFLVVITNKTKYPVIFWKKKSNTKLKKCFKI